MVGVLGFFRERANRMYMYITLYIDDYMYNVCIDMCVSICIYDIISI